MRPTRLWGVASLFVLVLGCASPVPGLWPPPADSPTQEIIVSVDTWHAMIAFPKRRNESQGGASSSQSSVLRAQSFLYEEWGYAERAWYLEGRQGVGGAVRALLWPSPGIVEVGVHDQLWSERTPQPPAEQFRFRLSEEGYQRLRAHLEASRASDQPLLSAGGSAFYPARRAYTTFHHCHHYAAGALREAGLPISSFWALTRGMFAAQLRRAEEFAIESVETRPVAPNLG